MRSHAAWRCLVKRRSWNLPGATIPRFIPCACPDRLCGFAWACNSPDVDGAVESLPDFGEGGRAKRGRVGAAGTADRR
jgi:hypothetical protein